MLKELTPELQEAIDLGIVLFAGEAEEQFETLPEGRSRRPGEAALQPHERAAEPAGHRRFPICRGDLVQRYDGVLSSFDAGRGCPFQCSFCTIINVQGRKSRWRDADDIERIVRENARRASRASSSPTTISPATGTGKPIFDRMIELREEQRLQPALPDPGRRAGAQDSELHREGGPRRVPLRLHRAGEHQSRQSGSHEEEPEPDHRIPQDVPGLEGGRDRHLCGLHHGAAGRHAGDDQARHRDRPEGDAGRPPRIHDADPAAGLGGPPEALREGRLDGPRSQQIRPRDRHGRSTRR